MNFRNFTAITLIFLAGCVSKSRETELLQQITELEQSLDDCQNGADKLIAKLRIASEAKEFEEVKSIFSEFEERHPDSEFFAEAKQLNDLAIKTIEKIAEQERLKKQREEEAERKRIEGEKQEKLKALNKLKKNFDDINGTTWYKNPYFTHYTNSNHTSIYIGSKPNVSWLRLTMSYTGEDWIFFEKAFLSYDGDTWEVPFDKYKEKETDNGGGVWEWIDVSVPEHRIDFLMGLANSKNAKMRLSGKYTKTRNLTWNERQGIKDVLNGYKALKEGIK
ncbi:hypothetical protein N6H18_15425 [Reichenbachiella agarivorans]|uniref:Uncharacterized protein n=1 Tax=Reichenbachiella agarivorans TaxID=2979464 RepID=A0ABY6CPP0_9BACT|nr:hypothetical protein [Reichenbachiella agarivorans]UXP31739.1 hypothetical protein N6H18_15425 [Reichenbachiella agarivorans]